MTNRIRSILTASAASLALFGVSVPAEAHVPGKRAAASDARAASESRARLDGYSVLRAGPRVISHRRAGHSRIFRVAVPIWTGGDSASAVYRAKVTHSYRVVLRFLYASSSTGVMSSAVAVESRGRTVPKRFRGKCRTNRWGVIVRCSGKAQRGERRLKPYRKG